MRSPMHHGKKVLKRKVWRETKEKPQANNKKQLWQTRSPSIGKGMVRLEPAGNSISLNTDFLFTRQSSQGFLGGLEGPPWGNREDPSSAPQAPPHERRSAPSQPDPPPRTRPHDSGHVFPARGACFSGAGLPGHPGAPAAGQVAGPARRSVWPDGSQCPWRGHSGGHSFSLILLDRFRTPEVWALPTPGLFHFLLAGSAPGVLWPWRPPRGTRWCGNLRVCCGSRVSGLPVTKGLGPSGLAPGPLASPSSDLLARGCFRGPVSGRVQPAIL